MRFLILILLFVGCKHSAEYNGKAVEYDEHMFSDQVDLYVGKKIIKKFKYVKKEKINKRTINRTEITTGSYSCYYSGMCMHYSYSGKNPGYKFGFSTSCRGDRHEKRKYTYTTVDPSLKYTNRRSTIILKLDTYRSSDYIRLDTGTCR